MKTLIYALIGIFGLISVAGARMITGYDSNNGYLPVQVEAGKYVPGISLEPRLGAIAVLTGVQGGTGISSTPAGNIGTCLQVSSVNPLIYTLAACSGGGSFTTTTIQGITDTTFNLIGAGGLTISTSSNNITFTQGAGSGGFTTTSIFGVVSTTFNFATTSDTNIGVSITTSSTQITWNPLWFGTLADGRIASASNWNSKLPGDYPSLATSTFLLQSIFGPYPAFATSSFLGVSYQALASSTYLSQSYPASATSTFLSKSGGTMTGGLTMTDATSTNLSISGLFTALGGFRDSSGSLGTDGMWLRSTGTSTRWQATSTLGFLTSFTETDPIFSAYPAVATSTFLLQSIFGPYPAVVTSTFALKSEPLFAAYPANATSTFLAKASTPAVTSTYQIGADGTNFTRVIPTTSLRFSGSNATTTMYSCGYVQNAFTSSRLHAVIHATAATGLQFILSYGANCDGSTASTTIGTYIVQNQVDGTDFTVTNGIPANSYLVLQGVSASSTNIDAFDIALLGRNNSN